MLLGNFSQGPLILSPAHSSTKVVFFFCTKSLFSASVCIHWGNGTHFKDKHEKHPDKTDNKQQAWVQKYGYPQSFFKCPLPIREQLQYLSLFVILSLLFLLFRGFPWVLLVKRKKRKKKDPGSLFTYTQQGCRTFSPSPSLKKAHLCLSFPLLLLTLIPLTFLHQKFHESRVVSSYVLGAKVL